MGLDVLARAEKNPSFPSSKLFTIFFESESSLLCYFKVDKALKYSSSKVIDLLNALLSMRHTSFLSMKKYTLIFLSAPDY